MLHQSRGDVKIPMRIKKVKITPEKKILMVYEKSSRNNSWDEYSFTCSDEARPEFYKAIKKLATHVIEMCELPDNYLSKITVRGVTFSYGGEDEVMGATISAAMELEKSYPNLNINTPHKASEMYNPKSEPDEKQLLSDDCVRDLNALQDECESYIKGERAQGSMFNVA
jgi:hypothetical protein